MHATHASYNPSINEPINPMLGSAQIIKKNCQLFTCVFTMGGKFGTNSHDSPGYAVNFKGKIMECIAKRIHPSINCKQQE